MPRVFDRLTAQIDADAERRLERRQELAGRTSEFQHTRALGNQELQKVQIFAVEERGALPPLGTFRCTGVGMAADFFFVYRQRRGRGSVTHLTYSGTRPRPLKRSPALALNQTKPPIATAMVFWKEILAVKGRIAGDRRRPRWLRPNLRLFPR